MSAIPASPAAGGTSAPARVRVVPQVADQDQGTSCRPRAHRTQPGSAWIEAGLAVSAKRMGLAAVLAAVACGAVRAEGMPPLAKQGYFFVGGKYFDTPGGKVMAGHVYVEYLIPKERKHAIPLVMIAG